MGNGAIVTFLGEPDNPTLLQDGEQNKDILKTFYERVWNQKDLDVIGTYIAPDFSIHRDGEIRRGIEALREMIFVTQVNFDDLEVQIEAPTSLGDMVAYRLSVSYIDVSDGLRKRVRGICLCRFSGDQIAESSVTYLPDDAENIAPGGFPATAARSV